MLVYLIHNRINGKYYVGWTSKSFEERWKGHCESVRYGSPQYFHRAIRLYGKEAFIYEALAVVTTRQEAKNLEKLWIVTLEANNPLLGYNMTVGGDGASGYRHTLKFRRELSEKKKGKTAWNKGKVCSWRGRKNSWSHKIAAALRGKLSLRRGKTLEELYGKQRALEIKQQSSNTRISNKTKERMRISQEKP